MEVMEHYNEVYLAGKVISEFQFDHKIRDKEFFKGVLAVKRLSDECDVISVILPSDLMSRIKGSAGTYVEVFGVLRSISKSVNGKQRTVLNVLAKDIQNCGINISPTKNNLFSFCGDIVKPPIYRKTPKGAEITELLVSIKRFSEKSDYLPCISWNAEARKAANLTPGCRIKATGRIQSREYDKKLNPEGTLTEKRTVNEVSIGRIEQIFAVVPLIQ